MGSRASADRECHGESLWPPTVSNFSCKSHFDPCPRQEELTIATQATIPCDAVQKTPNQANSRKVCPGPPPKSGNEDAQEVQSKQSKLPEDELQKTSEASARDRNSNADIADIKHVNGSCNIDIPEPRLKQTLLEHEDDEFLKEGDCPTVSGVLLESCQRLLESWQRLWELLRSHLEWLQKRWVPLTNILCGLWESLLFSFSRKEGSSEKATGKGSEPRQRIRELLWRHLESLQKRWVPLPNILCDLWEPQFFFPNRKEGRSEKATGKDLESLPGDLQESIIQKLPFKELTHAKAVSKSCKDLVEANVFRRSRGSISGEGEFTALNFFIKNGEWQCTGHDLLSCEWRRLPTLACLPLPDLNLFQQYSICGHEGLMCANVSKSSHKAELVVFNLLTGEMKELPPLKYSRNPVLLHIWVDPLTDSYKVIAGGSASNSGEKDLSRKIEVYDSRTSEWETGSDIRGPEFGLNEHQVGVCVNGVLYFVMFMDGDGQKGIVAFDIEKGEWLENKTCTVPFSLFCNTLQLLESSGTLYLFSEQERDDVVEHCIDVVELWDSDGSEDFWQLRTVVRVAKSGGRGLLVYPEYICVPFGIGKLCVFNTITRDGVVYDLGNGMQSEVLEPPPENQRGENFFCLNPVSFTLAPNFASKP